MEKMNIQDCLEVVNDATFEVYKALCTMREEIRKGKNADLPTIKFLVDTAIMTMIVIDQKTNEAHEWAEMLL